MITEAVSRHAGLVMAHAALVSSIMEPGELICPFVVLGKGDDRQYIDFPAESQDQAIDRAWSSLAEYRSLVDRWAMAREGLVKNATGKDDVLVVSAWGQGMSDAVVFTQRFRPKARGGFSIFGPITVHMALSPEGLKSVGEWFVQGIAQHPKGERWHSWLLPNSLDGDAFTATRVLS